MLSLRFQDRLGEKLFGDFSSFTMNHERVNFVDFHLKSFVDFGTNRILHVSPKASEKSKKEANTFKSEGNKLFQAKQYTAAIKKYNQGIRAAPHFLSESKEEHVMKTSEIGILIANRSACLFHCGQYEAAMCDIDCALHMGYPSTLRYKLLDRSAKCLMKLQRYTEAKKQSKAVLDALEATNLEPCVKENWIKSVNSLAKEIQKKGSDKTSGKSGESKDSNIELLEKTVDNWLKFREECSTGNLSDEVVVRYSPDFGRFVAASKQINAGSIIAKENPFASVLLPQFYDSHCYFCFSRINMFFPCRQCSVVSFCSYQCETKAWNSTHKLECPFMDYFKPHISVRMGHLALKMFFEASQKKACSVASSEEEYNGVLGLVPHEASRDGATNLHMSLLAYLLSEIVAKSDTFQELQLQSKNRMFSDRNTIQELLLKHLQIIQCNGFAITEMQNAKSLQQSKPVDIGMAIYPKCSYFNHACDPNIEFIFKGNEILALTLKDIKEDDQIYCDYGYVFYSSPKDQRQSELDVQYLFHCSCVPCIENWPLFENLKNDSPIFRCPRCASPMHCSGIKIRFCEKDGCDGKVDIHQSLTALATSYQDYRMAIQFALEGKYADALTGILRHMAVLDKLLCQPWKEYYSCHATVKQIFRLMGNVVN